MSAREWAQLILCPDQSLTAWLTEAAVAIVTGALIALACVACAAPRADFERLDCLQQALAAGYLGEELLALVGGCEGER